MAKKSTIFFCQNCGYESAKWLGQCPACKEWNTLVEETVVTEKAMEKAAERAALETEELINKCKVVGKAGLVIGGVITIGYGIYKVTPKVKSWWYERKLTSKKEDTIG